jgi:hypothetical protein
MIRRVTIMFRPLPRRAAPILLAPFLLLACQPLPHPFAENRPAPTSPILSPPDAAGIVVQPVAGAPAASSHALATAMVEALQKEDVPADTVAANARSYRLAGTATATEAGAVTRVSVAWKLSGADGHVVTIETGAAEVPSNGWRQGSADAAKTLVATAAPMLARRVEGDVPKEHAVKAATLGIAPVIVTGAGGAGGHELSLAIASVLNRAGVAIQDKGGEPPSYVLTGKVAVAAAQAGHQDVKIIWALSRADGKEIGQVSQENAVPAGSLEGNWGDTAYDVATAAVAGIVELLQRAQTVGS